MSTVILTDTLERMLREMQKEIDELKRGAAIPVGAEMRWPRLIDQSGNINENTANRPPDGWLERNGDTLSRTTFNSLFAEIGTSHGAGDGSTTFALPGGWKDLTLGTNWRRLSNDPIYQPQCLKLADGLVLLRGIVERTNSVYTLPSTIYTLPAGYLPEKNFFIWRGHQDTGANFAQLRMFINATTGVAVIDQEQGTNNKQFLGSGGAANGCFYYLDGTIFKASNAGAPETTIIKT